MNKVFCKNCKKEVIVNEMKTEGNVAFFCSECGRLLGTKVPILQGNNITIK